MIKNTRSCVLFSFSNVFASGCRNCLFLNCKPDSSWTTAHTHDLISRWDHVRGGGVHDLQIFSFGFLLITRTPGLGFGRHLVEIVPRSLPQLSKQLRDLNNSQKHEKHEIQNFKTNFNKSYVSTHRHFQLPKYTVWHVEFDSEVKNNQFLQPGWKN